MKFTTFILTILLAVVTSAATVHFMGVSGDGVTEARESAYDRVMRTGVLRCSYMNWMPQIRKNPNTGQIEGIMPEIMAALGEAAELKIEWTEELNVATYMQDLNNQRYDAECSGGWPNAVRGKHIYYARPFAYFPLVPFVRADDTRFDAGEQTLQMQGLTAAVVDGDTNQILRRVKYPHMKEMALPQLSSVADYLLAVASGKADITFGDYAGGAVFLQNNPGQLKALPYHLRLVPQTISFARGEDELKNLIDTAMQQLLADGTVDRILDKYETQPGMFVRVKLN